MRQDVVATAVAVAVVAVGGFIAVAVVVARVAVADVVTAAVARCGYPLVYETLLTQR